MIGPDDTIDGIIHPAQPGQQHQYATVKTVTVEEINQMKEEQKLLELRRQKLEARLLKKQLQTTPRKPGRMISN